MIYARLCASGKIKESAKNIFLEDPSFAKIDKLKFINKEKKEMMQKQYIDPQSENERRECFLKYISKDFNYSPTFEDFKEELHIRKMNPSLYEYNIWLIEVKKIYSNSYHYYSIWGARVTGYSRLSIDRGILNLINNEIFIIKKS